jgi:hypothetical protein
MKKIFSFFVLAAIVAVSLMVSSCQKEDTGLELKKGAAYPTWTYVDADWLDAEIVEAVDLGDGIYEFTIRWTLEADADLEELVKTQGGLTAGVYDVETTTLTTPWNKEIKKNFVLYDEEDGLEEAVPIIYEVTFKKLITTLPGEEVELTGDWTSKWAETEPVYLEDPNGDLNNDDDGWYYIEHQVGYAPAVTWMVP